MKTNPYQETSSTQMRKSTQTKSNNKSQYYLRIFH